MNLFKTISRIRPKSFWRFLRLSVSNILFLWPTYVATKACMDISTEHFGRKHYQNGSANAFRHALWNILIAMKCQKVNKAVEKVMAWTKQITDWHEETFFSKELPMKMDYHNNEVGRTIYAQNIKWSQEQFIDQLLRLIQEAKKIDKNTDLKQLKNQLVYITNDH